MIQTYDKNGKKLRLVEGSIVGGFYDNKIVVAPEFAIRAIDIAPADGGQHITAYVQVQY